ncbi:Alpha-amylase 3 [Spatholobus suberectus]|nr:Alpha-amylase 3 [Spatholobus suberectus]
MGAALLPDAAFGILPRCSIAPRHPLICRITSTRLIRKRNYFFADKRVSKSAHIVFSHTNDSDDTFTDVVVDQDSGRNEVIGIEDELMIAKKALSEAHHRQEVIEKERDQLLEELARSEAKKQEYITTILHDKEVAIGELEAAKSLFQKNLEESVAEKFTLESKLVLAKQDAVDLAVQVEKLAEVAFQQATSHILEDAQLRISSAETTAAEAAHLIEKQIKDATEGTISSIVEKSNYAIERALVVAEEAGELAKKSMETFIDGTSPFTEIAAVQAENIKLQGIISDIESQLMIARNEADKLKLELEITRQQLQAFEQRANDAEKALLDFQESSRKNTLKQEEEMKSILEKVKKDVAERMKAVSKAFKADLKNTKATVEAAKEVVHCKDYAYLRRCEALQRSLKASEDALKMWRQRAEMVETLLSKERLHDEGDEDSIYVVNGGRIDLLTDVDSQKWKLLSDGPRREIPQWMARRIKAVSPKFPPKKIDVAEALTSKFRSLELPTVDEVWSIAQEKPKEGDALIEHVYERETIERKRKALESALQRKTIQWQRAPEQTKLEPGTGTGTGREIVFQGFNWESWRRGWYLELAAKTADLSHCGVTAVWLPPPTQSVSPQGYMPSDLYNLNSSYGSVEELKYCIEEMHSQDLMALGDVVLNHRCAQKQSPNGVWNIFGGNLAWGPEAIVCDDPNFEGRGNPSSGDIFHAAPNIDHSQDFVRKDIKGWLNWLRNDIGFDGWRLDFVRGFSGTYVKEYIEASNPVFAIGEYWDSLAYEHGSLCYNQDAHRQRIINWINATGGTSSAFDITTKGILHSALHNEYWRLIDPQGKPTGVMGWWPSRAVTFLENHDTGSTQGHWPFPRDKLMQGYAYILTHPGTPVIFYDHFYDFGIHDVITELIEARRQAGIHCRSSIKIYHANNEGYVAHVGDALVMKLGQFDWNPSKENQLDGSWQKFVDKGTDYQVWLRQ